MSNRKPRTGRNIRARRQIEAWIRSLLSDEFHLHPDRIDPTTQLRHWGYGDEKSVALLAAKFNQMAPSLRIGAFRRFHQRPLV